jgi:hypothetical protein
MTLLAQVPPVREPGTPRKNMPSAGKEACYLRDDRFDGGISTFLEFQF